MMYDGVRIGCWIAKSKKKWCVEVRWVNGSEGGGSFPQGKKLKNKKPKMMVGVMDDSVWKGL